jgi:large subunit ribosomal protein L31e
MSEEKEKMVIYNVPLRKAKTVAYTHRAEKAVKVVREYVMRHTKSTEDKVWIDTKVNEALWSRSIQKPPTRIKLKVVTFEDGLVEVSLPDEQ